MWTLDRVARKAQGTFVTCKKHAGQEAVAKGWMADRYGIYDVFIPPLASTMRFIPRSWRCTHSCDMLHCCTGGKWYPKPLGHSLHILP